MYDTSGKLLKEKWITGLNAPKGIRGHGQRLVVAAVDAIVVIGTEAGRIERTIPVEGAKFLNDVAVDGDGNYYVSDTFGGQNIHRLDPEGKLSVFARSPELRSPPTGCSSRTGQADRRRLGQGAERGRLDTRWRVSCLTLDLKTERTYIPHARAARESRRHRARRARAITSSATGINGKAVPRHRRRKAERRSSSMKQGTGGPRLPRREATPDPAADDGEQADRL